MYNYRNRAAMRVNVAYDNIDNKRIMMMMMMMHPGLEVERYIAVFTCIRALGTPPAERGPSLENIYQVSVTVLIFAKVKAKN